MRQSEEMYDAPEVDCSREEPTEEDYKPPRRLMRVYIAGPITGCEDGNRKAFHMAEELLSICGFSPVNPHKVCADLPAGSSWSEYMRPCIAALMGCQAVLLLPGWRDSRGAMLEHTLATAVGIPAARSLAELKDLREELGYGD